MLLMKEVIWRVVGAIMEAPSHHIRLESECQRRFDFEKKKKMKKKKKKLKGMVTRIYNVKNLGGRRSTTIVVGEYDFEK